MAAEKQTDSLRSIVDQDAAITAYLDGLLRDPDADDAVESSAPRKAPGLKVITVSESTAAGEPPVDESLETVPENAPSKLAAAVEAPHAADDEPSMASVESEGMGVVADEMDVPGAAALEVADQEASSAAPEPAALAEPLPESDITKADATESSQAAEDRPLGSAWGWLRVGGMTMAIPADAIDSRHPDSALDPVPGAPPQVAGALSVDGRPRLVLSLASLLGRQGSADAETEVLLLGTGGLWGVAGERVEQPPELHDESVEWRSEAQRTTRRPWLAGTASAAGVAVLDVVGLRAALKASR